MRNNLVNSSPTINGYEYAWGNIILTLNGSVLSNITSINYSETTDYVALYGKGSTPVAFGSSNHTFDGSISLRLSEVQALQAAARASGFITGDITSLAPMTLIISYVPSTLGEGTPITDTLLNVHFKNNVRGMNQGDSEIMIDIPISIGGIIWGD